MCRFQKYVTKGYVSEDEAGKRLAQVHAAAPLHLLNRDVSPDLQVLNKRTCAPAGVCLSFLIISSHSLQLCCWTHTHHSLPDPYHGTHRVIEAECLGAWTHAEPCCGAFFAGHIPHCPYSPTPRLRLCERMQVVADPALDKSGAYWSWSNDSKSFQNQLSEEASDVQKAGRLWELSERLVGLR